MRGHFFDFGVGTESYGKGGAHRYFENSYSRVVGLWALKLMEVARSAFLG